MYVILIYDIEEKRVQKVCKFLRRYLHWVQNSAFEGEISEAQLFEIKVNLKKLIDEKRDFILIYKFSTPKWIKREIIGKEKNPIDNVI